MKTSEKTSATKVTATIYELFELAGMPIPETHLLKFCYTRKRYTLQPCDMVFEGGKWIRDKSVRSDGNATAWADMAIYGKRWQFPEEVVDAWLRLPNGVFSNGAEYEFKGFE